MNTRISARVAAIALSALAMTAPMAIIHPIAAQAANADPFRLASRPATTQQTAFVGRDAKVTSIAIVLSEDGTAVGYACDGTGRISTWFTGQHDAGTGKVALSGAGGAQLTYDFRAKAGSLVVGSTPTTFRLARATGSAGLYRKAAAIGRVQTVTGWIVGNDALVVGTGSVAGKPVVSVAETAGAAGSDQASETTSAGSTGSDPVVTGLLKNLRCGRLTVKISGPLSAAERTDAMGRMTDLRCNTALLNPTT